MRTNTIASVLAKSEDTRLGMVLEDLWATIKMAVGNTSSQVTTVPRLLKAYQDLYTFLKPLALRGKIPSHLPASFKEAIQGLPRASQILADTQDVLVAWNETLPNYPGEEIPLVKDWLDNEIRDEIIVGLKTLQKRLPKSPSA